MQILFDVILVNYIFILFNINIRYFQNIVKSKTIKDIRVCNNCYELYESYNNNQKYCIFCQDSDEKISTYNKALLLHKILVNTYYQFSNIEDEEINKIVKICKGREIKKIGVKKLEELINRLENMHSL